MGRVSKRVIDPEIEQRIFEIFRTYLAQLYNPSDINIFLTSLLSYTEQIMLAKRLAIAVMLSKNYTYEEIDEMLKVSMSTVTTIHKQILSGAAGYDIAVKKILSNEKHEKFWNKLEVLFLQASLPKSYGSNAWKMKSNKGKELSIRKRKIDAV